MQNITEMSIEEAGLLIAPYINYLCEGMGSTESRIFRDKISKIIKSFPSYQINRAVEIAEKLTSAALA